MKPRIKKLRAQLTHRLQPPGAALQSRSEGSAYDRRACAPTRINIGDYDVFSLTL
jgi:hypothetical protein